MILALFEHKCALKVLKPGEFYKMAPQKCQNQHFKKKFCDLPPKTDLKVEFAIANELDDGDDDDEHDDDKGRGGG